MPTTIGQIYVNEVLPPEYRDYSRVMGASEMEDLLADIAKNHPERYRDVSAGLMRVGNKFAYEGGTTLKLSDLEPPVDRSRLYRLMDRAEAAIRASDMPDERKNEQLRALYEKAYAGLKQETYDAALVRNNPFALQVKSKARGNQDQLSGMISTPGVYANSAGETIPMFIRHSYAEGLSPAEIWAGAYGARTGVTCLSIDTEVLMGDWSVRKIVDIHPGDVVMGCDFHGKMRPVNVVRVYDNGVQPVYRFTFRYGSTRTAFVSVDATEEHKMLARMRKWGSGGKDDPFGPLKLTKLVEAIPHNRRAERAKYSAQLALGTSFEQQGIHNDLALMLGLMAGDGCSSPTSHGTVSLSCADKSLIDDISEYVHGLGLKLTKTKGSNYNWVLARADDCPIEWYTTSDGRKFSSWARAGIWEVYGSCLACDKGLPDGIWSWDDESVKMFLGGLIATDGSVYKVAGRAGSFFSIAMNSLRLVAGVKSLLERRFGVFCGSIHEMQRQCLHHMYGITIDHPDAAELFFRTFENYVPGVKGKAMREAHGIRTWRTPDIGCKVVKKEFIGDLPVMDLEVDSAEHMFVLANGLISSNSTKFATRQAGELGKLLSSASIEQVVTEDDCGTVNGVPVKTDDGDNVGALLAMPAGGYDAGTVLTKSVLSDIRKAGVEDILVRSPMTCGAKSGVCSHCAGVRETGGLPPIGYNLGLNSASALAERLAQGSLNTKHSGKKIKGSGSYQGFDMIKRMATVPKEYPDRAAVSEVDGKVERIEKAPQGGSYVFVGDQRHYVPSGYDILVKEGDIVEAGDQLSDGVINPADAVRLKGIGEGRRYFANRFTQAFRDSGYKVNRRNVEAVAKALINNVVVDDEDAEGEMLPGDSVSYGRWSWGYRPRPNSTQVSPRQAIGQYLEQPALHYTIGTRVTKKVADELERFKVPTVLSNRSPVGVHPEMQSVVETTGNTDDWMARLGTTYLGKRLVEDVQQGAESHVHGVNPYPGMAKGTEFGQWGTPGHREGTFTY